jgi:muconolactone D-isomerase
VAQKFLVEVEIWLPPDMDTAERALLARQESEYGQQLVADGVIESIWRIPGQLANVGIWSAADATRLHAVLADLPMFAWATITVRALAEHPLQAGLASMPGS